MSENCGTHPGQDCPVEKRVEEVRGEVEALDRRLSEFHQAVADTNGRFGARLGKLESHNEMQDERVRQIKETQTEIKREIAEAQKEQKNSFSELRAEHKESMEELKKSSKESMEELKRSNKEILDAVTPLKHQVESLNELKEDVDELKEKPGKTWEEIKSKALGWGVALILAIVAVALGLSRFL